MYEYRMGGRTLGFGEDRTVTAYRVVEGGARHYTLTRPSWRRRVRARIKGVPVHRFDVDGVRDPRTMRNKRAVELLHRHLTAEQLETLRFHDYIEQTGNVTGHHYKLYDYRHVVNCDEGTSYCIYAPRLTNHEMPPHADEALSILLMIRHDERRFLKTANALDIQHYRF